MCEEVDYLAFSKMLDANNYTIFDASTINSL